MNDETVSRASPEENCTDLSSIGEMGQTKIGPPAVGRGQAIAVAATFTADLLTAPLQFWMEQLEIGATIVQAPYAQVIQELLNPQSLLSSNQRGFNVLLVRLEDWIRDRLNAGTHENLDHLRATANDFMRAVAVLRTRGSTPLLVHFCPASAMLDDVYRGAIDEHERDLVEQLTMLPYTHCSTHAHLMQLYSVADHENPQTDRIAHLPYTEEYFAAIATWCARRIAALTKPQYKVIAIDCDNTLWRGICGEDGPAGVKLTGALVSFQQMLVRQHDSGVLLCLCSKNNPVDVEAVFGAHSEMPLREEHLICSRINWKPKSENLRSLAKELDLALDSFILIDDSELECAEVQANCPGVLTLQLPQTDDELLHFIDHVWAFDRIVVTQDAKQRTAQYRQNRARSQALSEASDLRQFLASLELKVDVAPMEPADLPRVAELVQRTNQFNLTTIRRRASEIEMRFGTGQLGSLVVRVRDRFGDYGLVGALLLRWTAEELDVDTFVLSCRVLGREVEHRILNELGRVALQEGRATIVVRYRRTSRNAPAWNFLKNSFSRFFESSQADLQHSEELAFRVPAEYALHLNGSSDGVEADEQKVAPEDLSGQSDGRTSSKWHETAYRLSRLTELMAQVKQSAAPTPIRHDELVVPQTSTEIEIAKIWTKVLGVSAVGLRDDFFELGGNSLLAVQVIASIGSVLGFELSIYEFFEGPTVEQVARKLAQSNSFEESIHSLRSDGPAPLSSAQQRLWFIDRLELRSTAYHIPLAFRLRGELRVDALQAALDAIVRRHEVLRTIFVEVDGEPRQRALPDARVIFRHVSLEGQDHASVLEWLSNEAVTPFDLSAGPLIRGALLRLGTDDHIVLVTMHHIVSDGWSLGVLTGELGRLYGIYLSEASDLLPPLSIQYSDYAAWQRQRLSRPQIQGQLDYWKGHLQGAPALIDLPVDRLRPATQSYRGANVPVLLGTELTNELKALARERNVTLAMTLYTAWSIVLMRLSGQNDVVIGMPVAGRRHTEIEPLIGFFVNTLAVRVRCEDDLAIQDLLIQVKEIMLGAQAHQDVPFELVVEALQPVRTLSFSPVFQVALTFHNAPTKVLELPGLIASAVDVPMPTAQFDLSLSLQESVEGVGGMLNYASDLFDDATIRRWVGHFMSVLKGMTRNPREKASAVPLLSEHERRQVAEVFNATQAPYPQEKLLHRLFEEQVARTPNATAVVHEDESLTYAQLDERANRLVRCLRARGVGPDELVGLCTERSVEMLIGILGIWKAGGAYVPLDPQYPSERLGYMVENAAPKAILTHKRLCERLPSTSVEVIALDEWKEIGGEEDGNLDLTALEERPDQLAYVIYTSGSTGVPKGVMIEHRSVLNLWQGLEQLYGGNECERVALNASFNFDASVQQFVQLLSGRTLYVLGEEMRRDAERLLRFVSEKGIQGIDCTPSQLKLWVSAGLLERAGPLRVVLVGGEAIGAELWGELSRSTQIEFYNVYGPTECTVDATLARLRGDRTAPHIGKPMSNRRILILDRQGKLVPIGVAGEINIGGAGIARGYLNRPELTEERFIGDPFSADGRGRMYRTGDLGRWRADGVVEYLGRNDQQVKIRGFRIELGEIEAQLLVHERVQECVVVAREDVLGEKRLVAYVAYAGPTEPPSVDELRSHLKATLPEFMVPSAFVLLERLPLTPNGKLDRRALPIPRLDAYGTQQYEAPRGKAEETLAGIWQSLLGVERVGRQANFFELGGHSLLIVQLMERLRRVGLSAEVRQVFDHPTLADLAKVLTSGPDEQNAVPPNLIPSNCTTIEPHMLSLVELEPEHIQRIVQSVPDGAANIQDIYPLVSLQEGMLFHHLINEQAGDSYVLTLILCACSRERLDELVTALQGVIDRQDVLRTAMLWEDLPRPVQVVYRAARLPVHEVKLDRVREPMDQITEWLRSERQRLDLRQAPLMRMQVAEDPISREWYVLWQLHHIVLDATSFHLMISEVIAHLELRAQSLPVAIPYRNHVAQSTAFTRKHDADAFFRRKLADVTESTAPFGLLDVLGDGSNILEAREMLSLEMARRARGHARRLGVSSATLFHAAWALVVAHASGRNDIVFGSVLLGRLQGSAGAQRTIGMFINTLPLRLRLQGVTARALVEQTQRELVDLLSHEQSSLAAAQRCSGIVGTAPLFTSLLNYRHYVADAEVDWPASSGIRVVKDQQRTNYPVTMSVDDLGDGFTLTAWTDRRIDPLRVAGYLRTALSSLLQALEQAPHMPALSLKILPEGERRQLIRLLNATQAPYERDRPIHQLFEDQVRRTPNAVAVVHATQSLSYAQLNCKANQLARYLRGKGVGTDELVAVCLERGLEMVIGLLGILKAGGAYLPLDPNYPLERLQHMLQDAAPGVVLSQERLIASLPPTPAEVIALDALPRHLEQLDAENLSPVEIGLTAANLIYVIYTSGSTGRPKGTAMSHGAMLNLIEWHRRDERLGQARRVLQFAALSFDVAFQEIFSTLCTGGTLVLPDEWVRKDAHALIGLLKGQSIERLFLPPLMLQSVAEYCDHLGTDLANLRDVITAGEQLRISPEIASFFARLSECRLHNHYGPTETHVVTASQLVGEPSQWPMLPTIGRPIANTQIYILDEHKQPVPLGVAGDIYVGGANLARGYLSRASMTAERFVADSYADQHGRLYKTGDLGRWQTDGTIEYLGRSDDQVKVRGFRIELGEIEAQLLLHEQVREAAVVVREDAPGIKYLVAYVTPRDQTRLTSVEDLRSHLKIALPEHMVPSAFVTMESLPLTSSGKLDRRALPVPELDAHANRAYEPPRGQLEEILAGIWKSVLHVERVGRNDNFFDLGGHSLLVLSVLFKINRAFNSDLRVTDVYKSPILWELAQLLLVGANDDEFVDLQHEAHLPDDIIANPGVFHAPPQAILLTGATGFVGRFLLSQLLEDTNATIYCLVRGKSRHEAAARLRISLHEWDLWKDELEQRIVVLAGDLRNPRLGLDESTYSMLCKSIDCIYHCGASMNHLETYTMAKRANVDATIELVRLATVHRPKLVNYISTLGVYGPALLQAGSVVDELSPIDHERHRHSQGYVASKWVGEKIVLTARERGVPCNIFRLGLVWADSQLGRYDDLQREHRIIKSCLLSGYGISDYRYDTMPAPVDFAARAVVFLANKHHAGGGIFHISGSEPMNEGLFERCNELQGISLELVPLYEWIRQIKRLHNAGQSLPVVPLIEFAFSMDEKSFREWQQNLRSAAVHFDCTRTRRELEEAGIVAPDLSDSLLAACIDRLRLRDAEVRESLDIEGAVLAAAHARDQRNVGRDSQW